MRVATDVGFAMLGDAEMWEAYAYGSATCAASRIRGYAPSTTRASPYFPPSLFIPSFIRPFRRTKVISWLLFIADLGLVAFLMYVYMFFVSPSAVLSIGGGGGGGAGGRGGRGGGVQ